MTTLYGIKNCDTVKKTIKWLDANNISYQFHDYKKQGVPMDMLSEAIEHHGWETVLNKRGTTWRKLPDTQKENMTAKHALEAALESPSLIKRPILVDNDHITIGFSPEKYSAIFGVS